MAELSVALHSLFGEDYIATIDDPKSHQHGKPLGYLVGTGGLLWKILVEDGWSIERFDVALAGFVREKKYAKNWSPFDFLDASPNADLHDYEWVRREVEFDKTAMSRMESVPVAVAGTNAVMWKYITKD